MRRTYTILALLVLLLVPALACQTVARALNPVPAPDIDLPPLELTVEVPELPTLPPLEVTVPAVPTITFDGDAPDDVPIVADPENLFTSAGVITYETALPFAEVLAFYQEQMPANGWQEAEDSFTFGESAILNYAKDGRTAVVTLTGSGSGTSVLLALAGG